jgi:hypothetical protein
MSSIILVFLWDQLSFKTIAQIDTELFWFKAIDKAKISLLLGDI